MDSRVKEATMGQRNRRWIFLALLVLIAVTTGLGSAVAAGYTGRVEEHSDVCATHDVMRVQHGPEYPYQGKTYYFCYENCLKQFRSAPERFSRATDLVSGEQVDKAVALIYAVEGKVYFFSTKEHLEAFSESPPEGRRKGPGEGSLP